MRYFTDPNQVIPMIFYGLINGAALLLETLHLLPQEKAAM